MKEDPLLVSNGATIGGQRLLSTRKFMPGREDRIDCLLS